jgi:hypothetical protein
MIFIPPSVEASNVQNASDFTSPCFAIFSNAVAFDLNPAMPVSTHHSYSAYFFTTAVTCGTKSALLSYILSTCAFNDCMLSSDSSSQLYTPMIYRPHNNTIQRRMRRIFPVPREEEVVDFSIML